MQMAPMGTGHRALCLAFCSFPYAVCTFTSQTHTMPHMCTEYAEAKAEITHAPFPWRDHSLEGQVTGTPAIITRMSPQCCNKAANATLGEHGRFCRTLGPAEHSANRGRERAIIRPTHAGQAKIFSSSCFGCWSFCFRFVCFICLFVYFFPVTVSKSKTKLQSGSMDPGIFPVGCSHSQ